MSKTKLERARENPFLKVEEDYWHCPKCNGKLFTVHETLPTTMDGNTVYHCEAHDAHTFWTNPRGPRNTLRLNENASDSDFNFSEEYELKDGVWDKNETIKKQKRTMNEEVIAKWQPTGLLVNIESEEHKLAVAETLEAAAMHLHARWIVEGDITNDYDFLVFPIIRRMMGYNGHQRILNLRDLCREVETEWKAMGGKKFKETEEMEWKFIEEFSDRNMYRFLDYPTHKA